jgi:hypothetical protein
MAQPNIVDVKKIYGQSLGMALTTTTNEATPADFAFTVKTGVVLKINNIICSNIHTSNAGTLDIFIEQNNIDTSAGNEAPFTQNKTIPATPIYIVEGVSVATGSSLVVLDHPLYLMESTKFKAKADAVTTLHLTISYEVINTFT